MTSAYTPQPYDDRLPSPASIRSRPPGFDRRIHAQCSPGYLFRRSPGGKVSGTDFHRRGDGRGAAGCAGFPTGTRLEAEPRRRLALIEDPLPRRLFAPDGRCLLRRAKPEVIVTAVTSTRVRKPRRSASPGSFGHISASSAASLGTLGIESGLDHALRHADHRRPGRAARRIWRRLPAQDLATRAAMEASSQRAGSISPGRGEDPRRRLHQASAATIWTITPARGRLSGAKLSRLLRPRCCGRAAWPC